MRVLALVDVVGRRMRYAETVADYGCVILRRRGQDRACVEPGEPLLMRPKEAEERKNGEDNKHNEAAKDHGLDRPRDPQGH